MKYYLFLIIPLFISKLLLAQTHTLNHHWLFSKNQSDWTAVNLPHTWNDKDAYDDERGMYMGDGWYKKRLFIPKTDQNNLFIKFEGANQSTEVFLNGEKCGKHIGGYTAFVIDITDKINFDQYNDLLIKVNNTIDPNIPPLSADFTFYGGIYRDVHLIRKKEVYFDLTDGSTKGVYFSQRTKSDEAVLSVKGTVQSSSKINVHLKIEVFDPSMSLVASHQSSILLRPDQNGINAELIIHQPELWSPDQPDLYTVQIQLLEDQAILDEFIGKTGFRWFELAEDQSFNLNGKKVKLIGTNRHQDFAELGNALPDVIHRRDIRLLKEMGGNFIRISHYPQDPAVLEACDELGVVVWEEIPIVNYITPNDDFATNSTQMLKEMIRQHFNNSSIIMWGFMNEVLLRPNKAYSLNEGLTEDSYFSKVDALHKVLDSTARAEDPYRWVTIAHHGNYDRYEKAGLNDVTDITGWNIYYGWYVEDPNWSMAGKFFDHFSQTHPNKGIIVGEYGAGADPRIHAIAPKRFDFSIEWQTILHSNYLRQIIEREHVMGAAIWNLVDFGSEGRTDPVPRINSKGILTVDREPKDAYLFYKAALSRSPFLAIGNTHWRKRKDISTKETLLHPVHVFTNQKSINLFLNDESLGNFEVREHQVIANVEFCNGTNQLMVKSGALIDRVTYEVEVIPEELKTLQAKDIDISMNIGTHIYFYNPATDNVWIPERRYKAGSLGYVDGDQLLSNGWKVGVGTEIFQSDLEPVYQTHRDTITEFRADVPDGLYEVTLHFAEIYASDKREQLANNLGSDQTERPIDTAREFHGIINEGTPIVIRDLEDFSATPLRTHILVKGDEGIQIKFQTIKGSSFLCGIQLKGF